MRKNKRPLIISLSVMGVILVGFLTWIVLRVLTMETDLSKNIIYQLPKFNNLEELTDLGYGDYAVAIDENVVKESSEKETLPTASTAKMILGLVIMKEKPFELGEKGETIMITDEMYNQYVYYINNGGSNTKVSVGEEISEYDALMAVFLPSSNNMADTLAVWAFSSLENYKTKAMELLEEIGVKDTTIGIDASGFDDSTTSTASDLAIIGQKVLENEVLAEIVGTSEYDIPVAGTIENTNQTLGKNRVIGIKTGYIGDVSGYCLVSGYKEGEHNVTLALLGAPTRLESFNDSLEIIAEVQNTIKETNLVSKGDVVGYYNSWWTGPVKITADEDLTGLGWENAEMKTELEMSGKVGVFKIMVEGTEYTVNVSAEEYNETPSLSEKLAHSFGWTLENESLELEEQNNAEENLDKQLEEQDEPEKEEKEGEKIQAEKVEEEKKQEKTTAKSSGKEPVTKVPSSNCTIQYGYLMLINPNFTVTTDFIDARRSELVSVSSLYGIVEGNPNNGDNLLDPQAAVYLNKMVKAYEAENPGHTFETRSCYRARGTTCGRLCAATGTSDHHTGLTCDLLDPAYGTSLDTDTYAGHPDWQWLYANSFKYGFIDRFPEAWAGGSMSEPLNVDANGSTGLYETWHYRYVGVEAAREIATGVYNNGDYDSLEHYLKAKGMVTDLKNGKCN